MRADGIVIGAGVNELVCAHYLARSGRRAIVIERSSGPDDASSEVGWVPPRIIRDLELDQHGLAIHRPDPWAAAALPDGGQLELWHDMARSVEAIRRLSPKDAAKWPEFCERMARLARLLEALYMAAPPKPTSRGLGDLARLAGLGLRVRRLSRQGIEDLLRLLPMSVADLLDDWFESDALKGVLGAAGVMHLRQGPRSGGTAFLFLHHHVGSPAGVFRPPASNIGRVLRGLAGVEIRHGAEVARINARAGRATGVALSGGEEIVAPLIVSGADPRRTLLGLMDPGALDPDFVRAVRNIRCRGVVARVTLALDRAPGFSTLVVAPSLDYLERAYDDAKYGRVSKKPYLEARCSDEKRVEVHMQYVPHEAATGDGLGDIVAQMLTEHLNRAVIAERRVHSPRDLEKVEGFPEGQVHHAELALDQALWMRPVPELAHYRTPVEGLFLCGPGMHPGGGIAGAAGYNCAQELAKGL